MVATATDIARGATMVAGGIDRQSLRLPEAGPGLMG